MKTQTVRHSGNPTACCPASNAALRPKGHKAPGSIHEAASRESPASVSSPLNDLVGRPPKIVGSSSPPRLRQGWAARLLVSPHRVPPGLKNPTTGLSPQVDEETMGTCPSRRRPADPHSSESLKTCTRSIQKYAPGAIPFSFRVPKFSGIPLLLVMPGISVRQQV